MGFELRQGGGERTRRHIWECRQAELLPGAQMDWSEAKSGRVSVRGGPPAGKVLFAQDRRERREERSGRQGA